MNSDLRPELREALTRLYPGARSESLVGDASSRRFHRLFLAGGGTRVVMDYGVPFDGETDDVRLARIFERARLPVARVIDILPAAGALVLEDLGDQTLETAPMRSDLYPAAVRLAAKIATEGSNALAESERADGPALDADKFRFEMRFFIEHYVGSFLKRPDAAAALSEDLEMLAVTAAAHPRVLCHRDYHSRNIMVRPGKALALVDIQDARWGPDTYDLASLLRDAYVDLNESEVDGLFELYWRELPGTTDPQTLRERFDLVATQRMIKALGTFGYQVAVLGRERYKSSISRTISRLSRLLPASTQTASLAKALHRSGIFTD